tara:strand:- start:2417 stop:3154 length:738 start_codon:yes stop_codon:yes gene_type:complete
MKAFVVGVVLMVGNEEEEKIKGIVSNFIKCKPEEIDYNTRIDRSTIQSSVLIHRMFAELEKSDFFFENRNDINVFGDLFANDSNLNYLPKEEIVQQESIGIDIVDIGNMPKVEDFRLDSFYKQNFTDYEISYSLRQNNPLQSFAGRFAVKEAIIKADNKFKHHNFNDIEITNDNLGKPFFEDFNISISYSGDKAVAVALRMSPIISSDSLLDLKDELIYLKKKNNFLLFLFLALSVAFFYSFLFT